LPRVLHERLDRRPDLFDVLHGALLGGWHGNRIVAPGAADVPS
jgi:hypothetical protein